MDKRRGLLGRTALACPSKFYPPPRRRRSYQYTQPALGASGTPDLSITRLAIENPDLPLRHGDQRAVQFAATTRAKFHQKGRRPSLPLLTYAVGNTVETTTGLVLASDSDNQSSEQRKGDGGKYPCGEGFGSSSPPRAEDRSDTVDIHDATVERGAQPLRQDGVRGESLQEGAVKVLLRGLNQPFLVAAADGGTAQGVFFVDQGSPVIALDKSVATTAAAVVESQACAVDLTVGEINNRIRATAFRNRRTAGQTWRLRFLRWGAEEPITLVGGLCNPIALCVGRADSSVFVLEAVQERQQCNNDRGRHRHRGGKQQQLRPRKRRYRVCRLDGTSLSTWLSNEERTNSTVRGDQSAKAAKNNGPVGISRVRLGEERSGPLEASPAGFTGCTDYESDTEWETSSANSNGDDIDPRRDRGVDGSPIRTRVTQSSPGSPVRSARRRGVVDVVEILELPSSSTKEGDAEGHPEQPVDLCVLADGTIVVAFSRAAPLHGGASISKSQGVVRAFPAADRIRSTGLGGTDTAPAMSTPDKAFVAAPGPPSKLVYDADDGWLVAEGLPVVSGLVAGGGDAVYLSLCGAGHDGAVTAIGSLSAKLRPPSLKVDTRREGVRGGKESGKGGGASLVLGAAPVAGLNRTHVDGCNGGGGSHTSGQSIVPLVSGFAAAVAVDSDLNL